MNYARFTTSGLAWALVDRLRTEGYSYAFFWRPRYDRDPQPFLVTWSAPVATETEADETEDPTGWLRWAA